MVATRNVPKVIVQTASNLEASNAGWETQRWLTCLEWSSGAGPVVGYAKLSQWYGLMARLLGPNAVADMGISPNVDRSASGSLVGKLVRVCLETTGGTIVEEFPHLVAASGTSRLVNEPAYFEPVWHGIIRDLSFSVDGDPDSPGGLAEFTAAGLAGALDQVFIDRGYVLSAAGSTVLNLGFCPPFNAVGTGNRSSSTYAVGSGSAYIHDLRTLGGAGTAWTAAQILDLILAGHARPSFGGSATGWAWQISDPTGALAYTPAAIDLRGMSVLEAIGALISPRRGLSWYVSVSGATAIINVQTTVATAVPVGGYTLPACTLSQSLSIADQPWFTDLQVSQDDSASYDIIQVIGKQPWVAISVDYLQAGGGALGKGWTSAQETTWLNATEEELNAAGIDGVWRRFIVSATWTGVQYNSSGNGLRNSLATSSGGNYGSGGYTGARSFASGSATAPSAMLVGERMTPIPVDILGGSATVERLAPRRAPGLFYFNGTSWDDISGKYSITVESSPLAVVIDDGKNGDELFEIMTVSGAKLVVTIGVREAEPLAVSYIASQSAWPSSLPRVKTIEVDAEQDYTVANTVTGVSGSALTVDSATTIRDDIDRMRAVLALGRATWSTPVYSLRWTDRGRCLTAASAATFTPCTLIPAVVDGAGSTTVNAIVLRRTCSWQGDGWATSIQAERLPPDLLSL